MAKDTTANKSSVKSVTPPAKTAAAPVYTALELANGARDKFGVLPEVVQAALKIAGVKSATFAEAQAIVREFAERKVR